MLRVAAVEDNDRDAEYLMSHLKRFARENSVEIEAKRYENGILFLEGYRGEFDIVFMDIDMPAMNGMNTAKALRNVDAHVVLIFVTALARFALNGYEVDAFDFIVKPMQYNFFSAKMQRAVKKLSTEQRVKLLIKTNEKTVRLFADEIVYVNIYNHMLTFHTEEENVSTRGTMKDVLETLNNGSFAMCNKSCVVNLNHVQSIEGDEVVLTGGIRQQISRPRKTEFMQQLADFYGHKKINLGRF
ncbi:MAG: response regulator transcription factor [Clostridia bacterium]|nr:response regulator transcription factor [Clostridia bacterium]